jgi:hypothetical protein
MTVRDQGAVRIFRPSTQEVREWPLYFGPTGVRPVVSRFKLGTYLI